MKVRLPSAKLTATLLELSTIARQPELWGPHARLVGRKLPMIVKGLRMIGKTDRTEVLSIGSMIEQNAKLRPTAAAILYEDRRYSHRDVHEISNRWANWLASRGVGKGDVGMPIIEDRQGGVPPEEIDPRISGD